MSAVMGSPARGGRYTLISGLLVSHTGVLTTIAAITIAWYMAVAEPAVTLAPETIACFTATADAFTESANPDVNHGTAAELQILTSFTTGDQSYLYADFDLSTIPGTAAIVSATLELDLQSSQQPQVSAWLRAAAASWDETTLTWNNQPSATGIYDTPIHNDTPGIKRWDATTLVTAWHDGTLTNNGLILWPDSDLSVQAAFASRENTAETPPTLCINWQGAAPTDTATHTPTNTPTSTATPTASSTSSATRTPRPTWTPLPTNTATAGPRAPTPTSTPPVNLIPRLPPLPIVTAPVNPPDLSIHGIEITQGIQCFDTSNGLSDCPDNSLPLVTRKDSTARIYLRYSGLFASLSNVPVRFFIRTNNVWYETDATGRATANIDQGSTGSADVYFNINYPDDVVVDFYAMVDPDDTIAETNEANNRYPVGLFNYITLNFRRRDDLNVVGQRLYYHPAGYGGRQYAGDPPAGWTVHGGAADWLEQLLPIRNNGISYKLNSGYLDWTIRLASDPDGQHALIQYLNWQWILGNAITSWFGGNAFTGVDHVYGWAPYYGYTGGHADMPAYPHAGGLGVVGIGTDLPGASTDYPGRGALIFGHELVHDYDIFHTNTSDSCDSIDPNSDFPYASSSIQEFGFNPHTGKIYDPASTHDLMSYCPAQNATKGWISPFTWNRMFNNLDPAAAQTALRTADETAVKVFRQSTAAESLAVHATVFNLDHPNYDPSQPAALGSLHKIEGGLTYSLPPGPYAVELRQGPSLLYTAPFTVNFESEYGAHDDGPHNDPPFPPDPAFRTDLSFIMPWVAGTDTVALTFQGNVLAQRPVSANAPQVTITEPTAPITWTAGLTPALSWTGTDADGDALTYSVLYSHDAGATWQMLITDYSGASLALDVDALAGSSDARFRVVASDGVNTGYAETPAAIVIPNKAPYVTIIEPAPGKAYPPGGLVVLVGSATDLEGGNIADQDLTWYSDRQGELGHGSSVALNVLETGTHIITLTARDGHGAVASETRTILIGYLLHLPITIR